MDFILSTIKYQYTLIYLDDIVILSSRPEEHIKLKWIVLQLLKDAVVSLKLQKRESFTNIVDYSGHIFRPGLHGVANHTADAILAIQTPTAVTEPQYFLGLCKFVQKFRPEFGESLVIAFKMSRKKRQNTPDFLQKTGVRL